MKNSDTSSSKELPSSGNLMSRFNTNAANDRPLNVDNGNLFLTSHSSVEHKPSASTCQIEVQNNRPNNNLNQHRQITFAGTSTSSPSTPSSIAPSSRSYSSVLYPQDQLQAMPRWNIYDMQHQMTSQTPSGVGINDLISLLSAYNTNQPQGQPVIPLARNSHLSGSNLNHPNNSSSSHHHYNNTNNNSHHHHLQHHQNQNNYHQLKSRINHHHDAGAYRDEQINHTMYQQMKPQYQTISGHSGHSLVNGRDHNLNLMSGYLDVAARVAYTSDKDNNNPNLANPFMSNFNISSQSNNNMNKSPNNRIRSNHDLGSNKQTFLAQTNSPTTSDNRHTSSKITGLYNQESLVNADGSERFSRKVFVGGLPPDIDEEEIKASFRRYGSLVVDWPHKAESKSYFPPKGYAFLLFQEESSVQALMDACLQDTDKLYLCVSSPTIKDKPVQIRPWRLSDADYVLDSTLTLDPRKTVFVGGVPRPLKASELANIMNNLYGSVCYAGIDTDPELKYPKGAGRVAFSNHQSYIAAISARFVHLNHTEMGKRVEIKPYVLDDQFCDECQGARCENKFAPFFCGNITCLRYYCDNCWSNVHSQQGKEFHKPLVKEGADRPRTVPFRWP